MLALHSSVYNFCKQFSKTGTGLMPPRFKITSWNVNGLRAVLKKNKLQQLLQQENADIVCLNETRIDAPAYSITKIEELMPQYHHYLNQCKTKKGYSGVGIMTKFLPLNIYHDFAYIQHKDQSLGNEGRLLTLQFQKFFLVNVYKPNAGGNLIRLSYRAKYDTLFNDYIEKLNTLKPTIVVGDFNVAPEPIDLTNPAANENNAGYSLEERQLFKDLLSRGMIDGFRYKYPTKIEYTWWSNIHRSRAKNIGWRIDHILLHRSLKDALQEVRILGQTMGSDHCPIQAVIDFDKYKPG